MRTLNLVQAGTVFLVLSVACISDYPYAEDTDGETSSSSSSPTTGTTQGSVCGNAMVEAGESCDDGIGSNGPGKACLADCMKNTCGDGDQGPDEGCDDGNSKMADGCELDCTLTPAKCGDGFKHADEVCEVESSTCDADCTAAECGDGVVNMLAGETCDDAQGATAMCDDDCTAVECGDGKVNVMAGEACDNGENIDAPYSMNLPPPEACAAKCNAVKYCGDGLEQPEEACDDGNDNDVDECSNNCVLPVCGDGIKQGSEECDDKNQTDDDGCSNSCIVARHVFVSSATYTGNLGGVAGGNDKCKMLADASDLKGMSWRAWLSDGTLSLKDDLKAFEGWYRLPDGVPVVKGASSLFLGSLTHSINVDEKKAPQMSVPVWTGTKADGTAQADHCGKWTSDSDEIGGTYGDSGKADNNWTEKKLNNISQSLGCNITTAHIYCIQI